MSAVPESTVKETQCQLLQKRKAADELSQLAKQRKRHFPKRTLGDTLGMTSDARWGIPYGTSFKITQQLAAAANDVDGPAEVAASVDPDETLTLVFNERAQAAQDAIVALLQQTFHKDKADKYVAFIRNENRDHMIGRVVVAKTIKGFEAAVSTMQSKLQAVAEAFEYALAENAYGKEKESIA